MMEFNADLIYMNFLRYLSQHGPIKFEEWLKTATNDGKHYTEEQKEALRNVHLKFTAAQEPPVGSSSRQAPAV
jgi:hypothetical protein